MSRNKKTANFLKVINFDYPEWIPATVNFLPATWFKHGENLEKLVLGHPVIFPRYLAGDFRKLKLDRNYRKGTWKDVWGVTWESIEEGMDSAPVEHLAPLRDWETLKSYQRPDPLEYDRFGDPIDRPARERNIDQAKKDGDLAGGGLPHGAMYMNLYYLRGFTNFMTDIADRDNRLEKLIGLVLNYNLKAIQDWIDSGVEIMYFGDDLGLQKSLPMSPADWRRYLKPCLADMFGLCRKNGVYTYLHSDGHILEIMPDLLECGLNIINPQVRPNTLPGLAQFRGKLTINLDLDRQLFPFATKTQLENHIKEAIDTLTLPEGRFMLVAECGPDLRLETIETICTSLEKAGCRGM